MSMIVPSYPYIGSLTESVNSTVVVVVDVGDSLS
jgi:hypothetical protein